MTVLDAFAAGYASIPLDDIWPIPPGVRLRARAAVETGATPVLIAEAGQQAAHTVALHRARIRLYDDHAALIATAAAPYLAKVDPKHLAYLLALLAGHPRSVRRDQAVTTITGAIYSTAHPADWDDANTAAFRAVTARGYAEADSAPDGGGAANPIDVHHGLAAAGAVVAGVATAGPDWTRQQIRRLAWDLSAQQYVDPDDGTERIGQTVNSGDSIRNAAGDLMHGALSSAFVAGIMAGNAMNGTQRLVSWVTMEDDRVCQACSDNEDGGPYPPDGVPDCPAHPDCRCGTEAY